MTVVLDLRSTRTRVVDEDGAPALEVTDGDTTVLLVCGLPGPTELALLGAMHLGVSILQLAEMMGFEPIFGRPRPTEGRSPTPLRLVGHDDLHPNGPGRVPPGSVSGEGGAGRSSTS